MMSSLVACLNCGSDGAGLKCGRCKTARYCSAECQRKHWLVHKPSCGEAGAGSLPAKPTYDDFAVTATELGVSTRHAPAYPRAKEIWVPLPQHGNYSIVYKATHKTTKQAYALKVLDKAKIRRMAARHPSINLEVMQARSSGMGSIPPASKALPVRGSLPPPPLQEKHLGLLLSPHPGIARLHLTFQDEGRLFYLYDLVPGGELWTFLTAPLTPILSEPRTPAPVSGRVAALVAHRIVTLLTYLHRKGVAHRDLKPENVLVTLGPPSSVSDGSASADTTRVCGEVLWLRLAQLTLIDFATAKDVVYPMHNSRSDFIGCVVFAFLRPSLARGYAILLALHCSTPDYMAPEAIDNRGVGRGDPTDTRVRTGCASFFHLLTLLILFLDPAGGSLEPRLHALSDACWAATFSRRRRVCHVSACPPAYRHGIASRPGEARWRFCELGDPVHRRGCTYASPSYDAT